MPAQPTTPPPFLAANKRRRRLRRLGKFISALAALALLGYLVCGWYTVKYRSLVKPHTHFTLDAGVLDISIQNPIEPAYYEDPPFAWEWLVISRRDALAPRWRLHRSDLPPMPWARRYSLPLWPVPAALALLGLPLWFATRHTLGRCTACRYDLTGLTPDPATNLIRCPECGTPQKHRTPPAPPS